MLLANNITVPSWGLSHISAVHIPIGKQCYRMSLPVQRRAQKKITKKAEMKITSIRPLSIGVNERSKMMRPDTAIATLKMKALIQSCPPRNMKQRNKATAMPAHNAYMDQG